MQLIIDCGATKSSWCFAENGNIINFNETSGFNPNFNSQVDLESIITSQSNFLKSADEVYFYGTGCSTSENILLVYNTLKKYYPTSTIEVQSDMVAAARALLQHKPGLACILGTGTNACQYNGQNIEKNINSLGYVLGDEGSGYDIGKSILKAYFYNLMPQTLKTDFEDAYHLSRSELIKKVYGEPFPSRYVASFAMFAHAHIEEPFVNQLVANCFNSFIVVLKSQLDTKRFNHVCASGSVAYYFSKILSERLLANGLELGVVFKEPINNLVKYHQ